VLLTSDDLELIWRAAQPFIPIFLNLELPTVLQELPFILLLDYRVSQELLLQLVVDGAVLVLEYFLVLNCPLALLTFIRLFAELDAVEFVLEFKFLASFSDEPVS